MSEERSANVVQSAGSFGFLSLLFLLFLGLKLTHEISWSWWWVTAPIWGVPALVLTVGFGVILVGILIGDRRP